MMKWVQRMGKSLGRWVRQPSAEEKRRASKDNEAHARATLRVQMEAWVDEASVGDEEREQRKEVAREIQRALLHEFRFDSIEEEEAWLKEKAAEDGLVGGRFESFEAWLEIAPGMAWKVPMPAGYPFLGRIGPHINIENMALLTSLPNGLRVGGNLGLTNCAGLTSLPGGLHVGGNLNIAGFGAGLMSLPNGLRVGGRLNVEGCTGLTTLPDGLHVGGDLSLSGCTGLTSLPRRLRCKSSLLLAGCTGLTSLPKGLRVGGDLDLGKCTGLTSLPDGLSVGYDLVLGGCTCLKSLPDGLRVRGRLDLGDCIGLTSLPNGLRVGGRLNLQGCTGLTSLPNGLRVGGRLNLEGCTGLTTLPDGLHVGGDLSLSGCTGLTLMPEGLQVGGSLDLARTSLTSLQDGLHVGGDLSLYACTGFTSLPEGLLVDGNLDLTVCTGLTSLPEGLHVSGNMRLAFCTGLTSLPDNVLAWGMRSNGEPHNINLVQSGLPPDELARLQALNNPALRFHVSRNEAFAGAGLGVSDFPTLDAAAAFWVKEAKFPYELVISPFVEAAYVRGVLGFLSKLRRAKEFNNSVTKKGLAKRVVQVLELLTGEDNGVREELQVRMADAVDACSDKPMWALNQMQVLVHIAEARGDRAKLRGLGMGVMRLEVVHRHVRKAMDAMKFVDDVCVYLRFEIALRESLQLPVSALEMLYPSYITVTDESIAAAEAEALRLTEVNLQAWLPNWSEWQRQDREECADSLDFSALERSSTEHPSPSLRNVLDNEVADPVRLKPLAAVWSLQDLLKHWVKTGMDLNNTPRDVDYMRLNLTKCIATMSCSTLW